MKKIDFDQVFGQVVRSLRERKKSSQESFAHRIKRSQSWVSRVEAGAISVSLCDLDVLSKALRVSATSLFQLSRSVFEQLGNVATKKEMKKYDWELLINNRLPIVCIKSEKNRYRLELDKI